MDNLWQETLNNHYTVFTDLKNSAELNEKITAGAQKIMQAIKSGKKIVLFGNGGSAADAQHIAAEFVGRFKKERPAWNVFALTANTSVITSVANDYDYKSVFERQVASFLNEGDIAIGLTTSGRSENVLLALEKAKANGAFTIAMTGRNCLPERADLIIDIPSELTPHIQEMHMLIGHYWADYAENNI
ncbi:MAG: SIS domain-containing protein [Clostridia bacterium]|nr:SIS domain-containing protein [Clostridia bacterium]